MKIGDLARRTGMTVHTLRYYERVSLLPRAFRGPSKQREYDDSILPWIEFLDRLRTTGMSMRDMIRYADLRSKGSPSEAERREVLVTHRERVRLRVATLQACLVALDAKIAGYGGRPAKTNEVDYAEPRRKPLRSRDARTE